MSTPEIIVHADAGSLVEAVTGRLLAHIVTSQQNGDTVNVVLTGGRAGVAICDALAHSASAVDQGRLSLWWGDERYLPMGDPDRNDVQSQTLLDAMPGATIERVPGPDLTASAEISAQEYAARIGSITPDVTLLSLGPDGHVASLFPEHPALTVQDMLAVAVHGSPKPPPTRVSLTLEGLCRSREIWILASGAEKAEAVRLSLDAHAGFMQAPSVAARGTVRTLILLDRDAASLLPEGLARPAP